MDLTEHRRPATELTRIPMYGLECYWCGWAASHLAVYPAGRYVVHLNPNRPDCPAPLDVPKAGAR